MAQVIAFDKKTVIVKDKVACYRLVEEEKKLEVYLVGTNIQVFYFPSKEALLQGFEKLDKVMKEA